MNALLIIRSHAQESNWEEIPCESIPEAIKGRPLLQQAMAIFQLWEKKFGLQLEVRLQSVSFL